MTTVARGIIHEYIASSLVQKTNLQFHELLLHDTDTGAVVVIERPKLLHFVGQIGDVSDQSAVKLSRGSEILKDEAIVMLLPHACLRFFDGLLSNQQSRLDVTYIFLLLHDAIAFLHLMIDNVDESQFMPLYYHL